jgi:hypothetical protein
VAQYVHASRRFATSTLPIFDPLPYQEALHLLISSGSLTTEMVSQVSHYDYFLEKGYTPALQISQAEFGRARELRDRNPTLCRSIPVASTKIVKTYYSRVKKNPLDTT